MENFYEILGLNPSATDTEIRRSYRVLARRYHPDLNPGKQAEDKFKSISEGYRTLIDPRTRKQYDRDLERYKRKTTGKKFEAYRKQQEQSRRPSAADKYYEAQKEDYEKIKSFQHQRRGTKMPNEGRDNSRIFQSVKEGLSRLSDGARSIFFERSSGSRGREQEPAPGKNRPAVNTYAGTASSGTFSVSRISIIEVSVTMLDVITGVKKAVELEEPEGIRKLRVAIPAGVKSGSIVRLRSATRPEEELVLVVRVARHPYMQIDSRGLIVDIPISLHEAASGASIKVPTLDEEQIMLKVPAGTQSGTEFRVRGKGIEEKEGRGDIIYRMMIRLPVNENATGIQDMAETLSRYYPVPVRQDLPKTLKEAASYT